MRDITLEDTIYIPFSTRAFATGIPTTLASGVISAYVGAGLTQITAGVSISLDHDGVTGFHLITVVATAANGFANATDVALLVTTGTVDSVSVVGEVAGGFTIGRAAAAVDLANGTDGLGAIKAETALILTDTTLIVADTNELQGDWTNTGRLDLILDIIAADTTTDIPALIATAQTDLDTLTDDWADGGRLDLILDIIAVDTTTDIPALIATAQADLDIITDADGVIVGAAGVDLIWDEVLTGGTHNVTSSSGKRLRQIEAAFVVDSGTAQAGAATTITLASTADSVTNDIYRGDRIIITEGTGVGEHGLVVSYVASTRVATMAETWAITPDATSVYEVQPASVDIETWQHNVVTGDGDWAALKAETVLIVADTNELQGDWTNTGRLDTIIDAILLDTAEIGTQGAGLLDLGGMSTAMKAEVQVEANAATVDVITVDTATELAAVPAASPDLHSMVQFVYMALRNKIDVTASTKKIHDDAGTLIGTKSLTDDTVTYSEAKAS